MERKMNRQAYNYLIGLNKRAIERAYSDLDDKDREIKELREHIANLQDERNDIHRRFSANQQTL